MNDGQKMVWDYSQGTYVPLDSFAYDGNRPLSWYGPVDPVFLEFTVRTNDLWYAYD